MDAPLESQRAGGVVELDEGPDAIELEMGGVVVKGAAQGALGLS